MRSQTIEAMIVDYLSHDGIPKTYGMILRSLLPDYPTHEVHAALMRLTDDQKRVKWFRENGAILYASRSPQELETVIDANGH